MLASFVCFALVPEVGWAAMLGFVAVMTMSCLLIGKRVGFVLTGIGAVLTGIATYRVRQNRAG